MTTRIVTDETIGKVAIKQWELMRRVKEGTLDAEIVCRDLQKIIEGNEESSPIIDWQEFYRDVFGICVNFLDIRIPEKQEGFDRLIIIAKGISAKLAYEKCRENFSCWKWSDSALDVQSERKTDTTYAIWVRNVIEADEELKNRSADDIHNAKIATEGLEERFIHELKYFKETGGHLDIANWTLCSGSRYSVGLVPYVYWYYSEMRVDWCSPGYARSYLRSRQVVS